MKASELVCSLLKTSPYRDVLIKAGDKASMAGAHAMALSYYKSALNFTNEASWLDSFDSSYEKTLHLHLKAAELNWVAGDAKSTEALLEKIFQYSRTPLDRAGAYQIQQRLFFLEKKHTNGCDSLFKCLYELGVTGVKKDLTQEELREAYEEAKQEVLRIGFDNVTKIGPCKDKTLGTIMDVMEDAYVLLHSSSFSVISLFGEDSRLAKTETNNFSLLQMHSSILARPTSSNVFYLCKTRICISEIRHVERLWDRICVFWDRRSGGLPSIRIRPGNGRTWCADW